MPPGNRQTQHQIKKFISLLIFSEIYYEKRNHQFEQYESTTDFVFIFCCLLKRFFTLMSVYIRNVRYYMYCIQMHFKRHKIL